MSYRRGISASDDDDNAVSSMWKYLFLGASAVATLVFAATTPYGVDPNEAAVIRRLGGYNRTEGPGFHFQAPWPIESRTIIPTRLQREEVGYETVGTDPKTNTPMYKNHPEEVTMMTNDENLAIVEFSVQYEVKDPVAFEFNVDNPRRTLHFISQAVMRRIVAQNTIDHVLYTGKPQMQVEAIKDIQQIVDDYGLGIRISTLQFQEVRPPEEVNDAFQDVQRAVTDKGTTINEGRTYANKIIPEANGRASQIQNEALGYKEKVINTARGDADRFLAILEKYTSDPDITRRQLYIEQMRNILEKPRKIIVDGNTPINIFMSGSDSK
ncbi:MAG: FtsH protease activity modulator HflK [Candidatus Aenigmarchaeota archaeon]|nr:FtsH protease activity modulator HflK [Candidatus Aenigmarchaeota archaeon]